MSIPLDLSVQSLLAFLEYLYSNNLSYKVILNYLSSLKTSAKKYSWNQAIFNHHLINSYLRSISINSSFNPTPRGIYDIKTLSLISSTCSILDDPPLYRAAFLLAFFAFLRMSNVAPHSRFKFDSNRHFLRQDVIFHYPGAHILLKWTKTLQDNSSHHLVQIPALTNHTICPVRAVHELMDSRPLSPRPLSPTSPLFVHSCHPHHPVIDTTLRDGLRKVLTHLAIPLEGHGFHTFRR